MKEDKKYISNSSEDKIANIVFEKKNFKTRSKIGIKLALGLILAGVIGATISNMSIKYKYGSQIKKIISFETTSETRILDYTTVINQVSPSLVSISDAEEKLTQNRYFDNNTTGVIIDSSGIILTNYSALKNKEKIFVKLSSAAAKPIEAKLIVESEELDIALIKIKFEGKLTAVKMASVDSVMEGQNIVVLGNAIGDKYVGSVVPGIITSKSERESIDNNSYSLLEISAPINSRNTGGAICNGKGELVGIANLEITKRRDEPGLYYGLQVEGLQELINSTNSFKMILGVLEGGILIDESHDVKGFYIQELDKDGNAYKAGVKPTDIILEIEGHEVVSSENIIAILQNRKQNDILNCKVLRDGKEEEIDIKISD